MFIGQYSHSIDSKGRVIIPSKYREELGETFILTKGMDPCLIIYTMAEWSSYMEKMAKLSITNASIRAHIRQFTSAAVECEPDKNGRILIPANLKKYASLEKDIVSVGVISRIEIWDSATFEEKENGIVELDEDAKRQMNEVGL
jgi:MraZ protein